MNIEIRRLESGYWHIRGEGPCNWAQLRCSPSELHSETIAAGVRRDAFPEASEEFIYAAARKIREEFKS